MNKIDEKAYYEHKYELLFELYGVQSAGWDEIHIPSTYMLGYVFCDDNKKALISEYLEWEKFVDNAKRLEVAYYWGIDKFLSTFKEVVYKCLNVA